MFSPHFKPILEFRYLDCCLLSSSCKKIMPPPRAFSSRRRWCSWQQVQQVGVFHHQHAVFEIFGNQVVSHLGRQMEEEHKVRIYKEYHSVCPLVGIGILPTPFSPASVPLPPRNGGEGVHSPAGEGLGESQFRRLEKSLALCLLCAVANPNEIQLKINKSVEII